MKYIVYKITNNVNAKFYIGVHKTNNVNDNYFGSGLAIKRAITKYGIECFSKHILHIFDNAEEAFQKEKELVILSEDSYNLKEGGCGGFDHLNEDQLCHDKIHMKKMNAALQDKMKNNADFKKTFLEKVKEGRRKFAENNPGFRHGNGLGTFAGKSHKESSKRKTSEKMKQYVGEKNSGFNKVYICNDSLGITKRVLKEDVFDFTQQGWREGRIFKRAVN